MLGDMSIGTVSEGVQLPRVMENFLRRAADFLRWLASCIDDSPNLQATPADMELFHPVKVTGLEGRITKDFGVFGFSTLMQSDVLAGGALGGIHETDDKCLSRSYLKKITKIRFCQDKVEMTFHGINSESTDEVEGTDVESRLVLDLNRKILGGDLKVVFCVCIRKIDDFAFDGSENLTDVEINAPIEIGRYAFRRCTNLSHVKFEGTLGVSGSTIIHMGAFAECSKLEDLEIRGVSIEIGSHAFFKCTQLERINVSWGPGNVTIGMEAFKSCSRNLAFEGNRYWRGRVSLKFGYNPFGSDHNLGDVLKGFNFELMPLQTNVSSLDVEKLLNMQFDRDGEAIEWWYCSPAIAKIGSDKPKLRTVIGAYRSSGIGSDCLVGLEHAKMGRDFVIISVKILTYDEVDSSFREFIRVIYGFKFALCTYPDKRTPTLNGLQSGTF